MLHFIDADVKSKIITRKLNLEKGTLWLGKNIKNENRIAYAVCVDRTDLKAELKRKPIYAVLGKPKYLSVPGFEIDKNNAKDVVALPGAGKLIQGLLTFDLTQDYRFYTLYCEELNAISIICKSVLNPGKEHFILHTSQGNIPDQIRRCMYQLHIEMDKDIDLDLEIKHNNVKQYEWIKLWYRRLPAKKIEYEQN